MEPPEATAPNASTRPAPPGFSALSLPGRAAVAVTALVIALATVWHMGAVFFFVAPSNVVKEEHGETISDYVSPEFTQYWNLFAPNPPTSNTHVEARAEFRRPDGTLDTTPWLDMTQQDMDHVEHNLLPSNAPQHQLRRAWAAFTGTHDDEGHAMSETGLLLDSYLRRLALDRLGEQVDLRTVERVQVRGVTRAIPSPAWTGEEVSTLPRERELDWWPVSPQDLPAEVRDELSDEEAS
ncbi:DUF5819 family protein [Streptomyces sp. URMC 129]|uniref:DUF5819 family protein n=1 Tax=Streptomyces sp. URMC 129 TaxID=3423407 RepID=UPI003F1D0286